MVFLPFDPKDAKQPPETLTQRAQEELVTDSRHTLPAIRHPRDLIPIREAVTEAYGRADSMRVPSGLRAWLTHSHFWDLYFTRPDFADLHAELRSTIADEDMTTTTASMLRDIVEEKGDHGAMIIAFDDRHQPRVMANYETAYELKVKGHDPDGTPVLQPSTSQHQRMSTLLAWTVLVWMADADGTVTASGMTVPSRYEDDFKVRMLDNRDPRATAENIVIAWMMLTAQTKTLTTIAETTAGAGLPPKVKKQMSKAEVKSKITVVDLRRTVHKQIKDVAEADRRHLDHRFIVRAHWRKQACGVGRKEHRLTFIAPYVKGPEGAPFMQREKVFRY